MKIRCPYCPHEFEWKPPAATEIYKMTFRRSKSEDTKPKRYVVSCPKCDKKFNVSV